MMVQSFIERFSRKLGKPDHVDLEGNDEKRSRLSMAGNAGSWKASLKGRHSEPRGLFLQLVDKFEDFIPAHCRRLENPGRDRAKPDFEDPCRNRMAHQANDGPPPFWAFHASTLEQGCIKSASCGRIHKNEIAHFRKL